MARRRRADLIANDNTIIMNFLRRQSNDSHKHFHIITSQFTAPQHHVTPNNLAARSDVEPTIRCNATIALAKCALYLPETVRDKVIASSMQKVRGGGDDDDDGGDGDDDDECRL